MAVVCWRYNGMVHGIFLLDKLFEESRLAIAKADAWVKQVTTLVRQ
jgi:hypothetical protein